MKGIDVSSHQGNIDWSRVSVDFAIIRLGYGDDIERQDDIQFLNNVNGCIRKGIPFAVYLYSYAKNRHENESIESEISHAKRMLGKISQKPFCVYIDMEDDSTTYLGKTTLTDFALYFCEELTNAGYKAGVYANENWFRNYLDIQAIAGRGYSIWAAKYSNYKPNIASPYDIWQYSANGRVDGISGDVDMNVMERNVIGSGNNNRVDDTQVNVIYQVKTKKHGWLPEVVNLTDFAGFEDSPITALAMRVDRGSIKYCVHVIGKGWYEYVDGCDINDIINGFAGDGENAIDCVEAYYYTPDDIRPYKKIYYKVNDYPYQIDNEVDPSRGLDGFGGVMGVAMTKFQAYVK